MAPPDMSHNTLLATPTTSTNAAIDRGGGSGGGSGLGVAAMSGPSSRVTA